MSVYDDLVSGTDAVEQLRRAIPATQFIDLENRQCVGRFGLIDEINVWTGVVDRDDDTKKQYVALNKKHTTVMLLDEDDVDNMIETLKEAKESFKRKNGDSE